MGQNFFVNIRNQSSILELTLSNQHMNNIGFIFKTFSRQYSTLTYDHVKLTILAWWTFRCILRNNGEVNPLKMRQNCICCCCQCCCCKRFGTSAKAAAIARLPLSRQPIAAFCEFNCCWCCSWELHTLASQSFRASERSNNFFPQIWCSMTKKGW